MLCGELMPTTSAKSYGHRCQARRPQGDSPAARHVERFQKAGHKSAGTWIEIALDIAFNAHRIILT